MNWSSIYVDLASAFGWTFKVIDEMTMPEVNEIYEEWKSSPPLHRAVLSYMGFKPKSNVSVKPGEVSGDMEALAGLFGETVGVTVEKNR